MLQERDPQEKKMVENSRLLVLLFKLIKNKLKIILLQYIAFLVMLKIFCHNIE